jgi:hypothetical protein
MGDIYMFSEPRFVGKFPERPLTEDLIKLHETFDADEDTAQRVFLEKYGRYATIVEVEDGRFLSYVTKAIEDGRGS